MLKLYQYIRPNIIFLYRSKMSQSAANIRSYISSTWDLALIPEGADTIANGYIMKALLISDNKTSPAKSVLEQRLGRPVDKTGFSYIGNKLKKNLLRVKNATQSKKLWVAFKELLNKQWTVPAPRPLKPKRHFGPAIPMPSSQNFRSYTCDYCPVLQAQIDALRAEHAEEIRVLKDQIKAMESSGPCICSIKPEVEVKEEILEKDQLKAMESSGPCICSIKTEVEVKEEILKIQQFRN